MVLAAVLAVLALVGLLSVAPVAASNHQSATRSLAATVASGGTVTVTIAISGVDSGYIQETLHDDFTFVSSANAHDLSEDGRTLTISFQSRASVSYVVRAPQQAGAYTFPGGKLKDIAGDVDLPVTGADRVTVTGTGATTPKAERSLAATVASGGTVTVTIAISGVDSGYIQETLHDDFTFVSSANTHDLSEDGRTLTISFQSRASVSYVVRAPQQAGAYTFPGGKLKDIAGDVDLPVTGADRVTVTGTGATTPKAERSLAATVASGGTVAVTIAISGVDSGYIQETLHDDFTFVSSANTHDLSEDGRTLTISFQSRASVSYVVRAPQQAGAYTFPGGKLKDIAGDVDLPVTGADRVTVTGTPSTGGGGGSSNRAPVFRDGATAARSVAEDAVAGASVGSPVTASDSDGDRITYSLGGDDASLFAIDPRTGQVSVGEGTALDFETKSSYAVTARAADRRNSSDTIALTITVTNVGLDDSYDANDDGMIDGTEVLNAVEDYFNDVSGIDSERILDIVELYFSS